jgi:hypothetical protein
MKYTKLFSFLALLMVLFVPLLSSAIPNVGQCPANIGFEQNSFSGWTGYTGRFGGGSYSNMTAGIVPGRHGITSSGFDNNVPFIPQKCPLPGFGSYSAKLGNSNTGSEAERLTTTMTVGSNNSALIYSFAAVLEDPGHPVQDQPRFQVSIRDGQGNALSCGSYTYISGQNIPFQTYTNNNNNYYHYYGGGVLYRDWSTFAIDLTAYIGQTITIEYSTADCGFGGHFGYAYVDNRCDIFNIAVRNCPNDPYISLFAPDGFQSYSWSPGNQTTQSIYVLSPTQTPSHTALLIPFNGQQCAVTLTRTVSNNTNRTSITTTATNVTCYGSNNGSATGGLVNGVAFGSGLPFTYSWGTNPVQTAQTATGLAAGSYAVTITDALGCAVTGTINITQPQRPFGVYSNSPICGAGNLQLSADSIPGGTYSWTGPNGFTSNQRNPLLTNVTTQMAGYYNLTIMVNNNSMGCAATLVNISTGPNAPSASSNSPVNFGATLNLSASTVNGATGYRWTGPNGFTANTQNASIPNASPGLHNGVYSVVALSSGCPSAAATVSGSINPPPFGRIVTNSPVCEGGNLYMSGPNALVLNSTYSWTGPNGFTFSGQTPSIFNVTLAAQGMYYMTLTQPGLSPYVDSTYVTIGGFTYNIQASGTNTTCTGGSIQLSVPAGIQGATYSWVGPNNFTANVAQTSVSPVTSQSQGVYSVTVTSPGCQTQYRIVTVSVLNTSVIQGASNSPICTGTNLNLSAQTIPGVTYSWAGPNGYSSSLQTPTITNAQTVNGGVYSLTANVPGCAPGISTLTVAVNSNTATFGSNSPLCAGSNLTLSANTAAQNATYAWTGPNGFTSSSQYPVVSSVTNSDAGLYSVEVSIPGCSNVGNPLTVAVSSTSTIGATATTPICEGTNLQLGASLVTGATYSWSGPNGYTSALRTPVILAAQTNATGTYMVTATIPGCGSASSSVAVTVGTSPVNVLAGTNAPVCLGGTLMLSASPSNGFTYSWSGPNGFTSSQANATVTSNASTLESGEYTLTVSSTGCTPRVIVTPQVSISGANTISAGSNGPICQGSNLLLNASLVTGATYSWSGPNSFTSAMRNPSIAGAQPSNAGDYTVTAAIPGCSATMNVVTVTIGSSSANVTVATNSPVCINSALNLSTNPATGFTYSWAGPNGFTSALANPVISNASTLNTGEYTLTVSSTGCAPRVLTTSPVALVGSSITATANTPVCVGTTLQFSATNLLNATYAWSGPNGFTSALRNPSIVNAQSIVTGTYTVTATVPGCGVLTTTVNVTVGSNPNGVTITSSSPVCEGGSLNLSANPATGFTYNWAGPNGFTSNVAQPVINPVTLAAAGEYTLTVGVSGCNNAIIRTFPLVVNSTGIGATATPATSCQGSTLNFAGNNITGSTIWAWYGPDGWSSNLRLGNRTNSTPAMSGTYTFTANKPGCGIVSTTLAVTVGRTTTGVLAPNQIVCENSIIQFTVSQPTGYTYSWTGPNGFTSNLSQPTISSASQANAGIYTLTISSTGCSPTTRNPTVTVNSIAGFSVSANSPLCETQSLFLSAPNLINTTNNMYVWTGPAGFSQANRLASRSQMTPTNSGNYSLNMNIPGCGTVSGVVSVVVGFSPLIHAAASVNTPICINGTLNLTAVQRTNFTYSWSGPAGFVSNSPTPNITNATGANAGEYSCTITSPGCPNLTVVTGADAVVNNPATLLAGAVNSTRCASQALNLTATQLPNTTYTWSGPGGWSASGLSVSRNAPLPVGVTTYNLSANIGGCGVTTRTVSVTVNNCRTNQNANNGQNGNTNNDNINPVSGSTEGATPVSTLGNGAYLMSVSPNPFDGSSVSLHIEGLTENASTLTVSVWEIGGRKITEKVISLDANTTNFDTALTFDQVLSKGYYILQTEIGAERRQLKLLVH